MSSHVFSRTRERARGAKYFGKCIEPRRKKKEDKEEEDDDEHIKRRIGKRLVAQSVGSSLIGL